MLVLSPGAYTGPYNKTLTFQTPLDVFMNFFMHAINTVIQDRIFSNVFLCFYALTKYGDTRWHILKQEFSSDWWTDQKTKNSGLIEEMVIHKYFCMDAWQHDNNTWWHDGAISPLLDLFLSLKINLCKLDCWTSKFVFLIVIVSNAK